MQKHRKSSYNIIIGLAIVAVMVSLFSFGGNSQAQSVPTFSVGQQVASIMDLNLRSGPAKTYASVGVLKQGQPASVTGPASAGWYPLDYNGLSGWASGEYLRPYSGPSAATATPGGATPQATPTEYQEELPPHQSQPQPTASPAIPNITPVITSTQPISQPVASPTPAQPTYSNEGAPGNKRIAAPYKMSVIANAQGIMMGQMTRGGNIRAAAKTNAAIITSWWTGRKVMIYATVTGDSVSGNSTWYKVGIVPERTQEYFVHSSLVKITGAVMVPPTDFRLSGRWVDVNLTQQTMTAYQDSTPVLYTLISSGAFTHTTNVGYWKIYWRLEKQEMKAPDLKPGDPGYYDLKDVPYPQYFNNDEEAIHGTYWHDNFGTKMSHGCVNSTTPTSEWMYKYFANIGTPVVVHY